MLVGLLLALLAAVGVVALSIRIYRADRTEKGRALSSLALDPLSLNQIANPIKGKAASYIEEMKAGHEREDEGEGDGPPDLAEVDPYQRAIDAQMRSTEAYLKKRGARGKQPDNGARV